MAIMRGRTTGALATLAAAATMLTAGAGAAQAVVVDNDTVKLTSSGFDFGNSDFVLGAPSGSGDLDWIHTGGRLKPHLTGTLHLDDVDGDCARMRLDYSDADGDALATRFGGTVCASDDHHHEFTVDLQPYESAYVDEVKVTVEKQTTPGGAFATADYGYYHPDIVADDVKITESGFDFGDEWWGVGAPIGDGHVLWPMEDGRITPLLSGTLHLNDVAGGCARMNLRYLTESGTFIASRAGGTVCASDNDHHEFTVSLDPYTSNTIGKVNVQLQSLNVDGSYSVVGHQVASVGI